MSGLFQVNNDVAGFIYAMASFLSPTMKAPAWLFLLSMAACSPKPAESSYEMKGSQSERIAAVSQLISKHASLPGALLDAHFFEEQIGDGRLGPSDFTAFYALTIAPADLPVWNSALAPIQPPNTPPEYTTPKQPLPWWLTQDDFLFLKFYEPKAITGRIHGWIGIAPNGGKIFIYVFTM